ncbi:Site-specific recombinase XerD DNA replication protein [Marine Group I thaumarchaeote SCGC AAA799-P11]|uniref:Site-specific recombinase XerD DNA replication protein n=1 Tax=Marine Group I thaumarchaeote SCGC AAA799-P11 TaxID=1502295 RepID=A0A087RXH8_9ARCH|nr:Site-specific recombinase XerD DNA replication protein [Marine Group I thaumarchaeote SCGC AAA799-P11]
MSKTQQIPETNQKENIHRRTQWISRYIEKQHKQLSSKNLETFLAYNNDMIVGSVSENTRYKNLSHFGLLTKMLQKDWVDVTESDLRELVAKIMIKHGENGKETGYSFVLKISLKAIVRFAKLGSRNKPEDGELQILKFIKSTKPKDKLTREDLPTDEEVQKILTVCADSSRDKAMISVHAEAGTRIGELLGMKIKDFTLDKNGGMIKVDGKTGVRPIRIVKSVPYLTRWLNDHPNKDNHNSPLWVYIHASDTFGEPINYAGFNSILQKRIRQAGITKRISSHLFRHKEITDLATKLTESESRMRHGWEKTSLMPSRYTHLNQENLDEKMLEIMGVKQEKKKEDELRECVYCKIRYPVETRFCDTCSRPLDVADAIQMEKEQEERTRALIMETLRQEHSNKSKNRANKENEKKIIEQQKEIEQLKKLIAMVRK